MAGSKTGGLWRGSLFGLLAIGLWLVIIPLGMLEPVCAQCTGLTTILKLNVGIQVSAVAVAAWWLSRESSSMKSSVSFNTAQPAANKPAGLPSGSSEPLLGAASDPPVPRARLAWQRASRKVMAGWRWSRKAWRYTQRRIPAGTWTRVLQALVLLWHVYLLVAVILAVVATSDTRPSLERAPIQLAGVRDTVSIARSTSGVLHIKAKFLEDALFGQGWAAAQDRLVQMDVMRRIAGGRLSELVGEPGLDSDRKFRTFQLQGVVEKEYANLPQKDQRRLDSFIAGINAFLDQSWRHTPVEYRVLGIEAVDPFVATDALLFSKMLAWSLCINMNEEVDRYKFEHSGGMSPERVDEIWPKYPDWGPTILPGPERLHRPLAEVLDILTTPVQSTNDDDDNADDQHFDARGAGADTAGVDGQRDTDQHEPRDAFARLRGSNDPVDRLIRKMVPPMPDASNSWVVHGSRTKSGMPILSNDPHLALSNPSLLQSIHIQATEPLYNMTGAAFALLPGVVIGHNNNLAWGITNCPADTQDVFVMRDDHATGYRIVDGRRQALKYEHQGVARDYTFTDELIHVRGGADVPLTVVRSHYGPVINSIKHFSNDGDPTFSMAWTVLDPPPAASIIAFIEAGVATTYEEWSTLLPRLDYVATLNLIFADIKGNIAYHTVAAMPQRVISHDGSRPTAGDGTSDWIGVVPAWHLPSVLNPDVGYIVTANNPVYPITSSYPFPLQAGADFQPPYRAMRIADVLASSACSDAEDMKLLQQDTLDMLWTHDMRGIATLLPSLTPRAREWRNRLVQEWDGAMDMDSQEAAVWAAWWAELTGILNPLLGKREWKHEQFILAAIRRGSDPACSAFRHGQSCTDWAAKALDTALDKLTDGDSRDVPTWGSLHRWQADHMLFGDSPIACIWRRPVELPGSSVTVNVAPFDPETFDVDHGPAFRMVIDMDGVKRGESQAFAMPLGSSGDVFSERYDNLQHAWRDGKYVAVPEASMIAEQILQAPNVPMGPLRPARKP